MIPCDDVGVTIDPGRRRFLHIGMGAVVVAATAGCSSDGTDTTEPADPRDEAGGSGDASANADPGAPDQEGEAVDAALAPADFEGLATCRLLPEQMAGPFPLDEQFRRRDITEGLPGHPLRLGLRVVDEGCAPVPDAEVEVWHADASGDYSAFEDGGGGKDEGPGTTFLRGTQVTDADGIVELRTIYPGWYRGRAVHIHVRVRIGGDLVLTSQMYFDDAYTEEVYTAEPYAEFGSPDTPLAADGIGSAAETEGTLLVTTPTTVEGEGGALALLNLGIDGGAS